MSFGAVHLAIHPCGPAKPDGICDKPQGILAKANNQGIEELHRTPKNFGYPDFFVFQYGFIRSSKIDKAASEP
jgi:hypothetical protein